MRKQASFWPARRSLFRSHAKRKGPLVWITIALAVAAAWFLIAVSRVPPV